MKKIFLISALLLSFGFYKAEAQVSVNINIGRQPVWGPVGYDYVDYYYLPDMDVYYDVPHGQFIYFEFGRWNFASTLPARYGRYDLYHSYKVVVNQRDPWLRSSYYRNHYASYRGRFQPVIRDNYDNRYYTAREHYQHERYSRRTDVMRNDRRNDDWNYRENNRSHERNGRHRDDHGRGHDDNWH